MSADTKPLKTALNDLVAPQSFDVSADEYVITKGTDGVPHSKIVDAVLPAGASTSAKQDTIIAALASIFGVDFATDAELALVKAELEAIKAKLNGTIVTEVSGRTPIEIVIANQVEIRNTDATYFSVELDTTILGKLKDFEVYITDTHFDTVDTSSLDLRFAFGQTSPSISYYASDNIPYRYQLDPSGSANGRTVRTTLKGTASRQLNAATTNRSRMSMTHMLKNAEYKFFNQVTEVTTLSIPDKNAFIEEVKKAVMRIISGTAARFYIRYDTAPTAGSITIVLKGWV